jgi:hypothetical protein
MTTLNREHVTPKRLMSLELRISYGAVFPASQHGAAVSTPNGRLVSEDIIGRRTQNPPEPRAERRRSSATHTSMRVSRSPPAQSVVGSPRAGGPRTLPRSSLTVRLHGRTSGLPRYHPILGAVYVNPHSHGSPAQYAGAHRVILAQRPSGDGCQVTGHCDVDARCRRVFEPFGDQQP